MNSMCLQRLEDVSVAFQELSPNVNTEFEDKVPRSTEHHWARTSQRQRVTQGVFPTLSSSPGSPGLGGMAGTQHPPRWKNQDLASLIGVQEPPSSCPEIPAVIGARPGMREGNDSLMSSLKLQCPEAGTMRFK
ncbi:uncharacterized protein J5F26_014511 isoform 4-T11 [Ciconia maguari]